MALSSRQSRRDVLKLTAYSTAGALLAPSIVRAQTKSLTMMHESSFVPPYDAFFKNKLATAYEKAKGIKVNYEVVSVGSLLTRVTTAAENSSGPDMTAIGFNWAFLFDDKFLDVTDIAAEIGKESGGWYESAQESVVVNGKWKAIPFGNIGQLMNWRTDWFKQAGYDKFPTPGTSSWKPASSSRRRATRSASSSATASATITAGSIRSCGPTAPARSSPTARPS